SLSRSVSAAPQTAYWPLVLPSRASWGRRSIGVGGSHGNQRMLLHALLERRHHLQDRPHDPGVQRRLALVLCRVRVEIEEQRDAELFRGGHHRVLPIQEQLVVA